MAAYYPRPEASPGLARWRDGVFRRKSTSGASATGPESRRPKSRTSRRVAEPTRHRARKSQTSKPASTASTPVAVPDAPAISMPRRRRTLPFAFSRRSLTYALGHSQWQKPPVWSKQVQPTRTRSRGRRPREIRPPNHHRRSRTARALLPTVAARHCVVLTGTCSTGSRLERGTREPWLEFTQDSQPQRPHRK